MWCLGVGVWAGGGAGRTGFQVSSFDASCLHGSFPALAEPLPWARCQSESLGRMAGDQNEGQLANSWITHLFTLLVSRLIIFHQGCIYYRLKVPVKPPSLEGHGNPGRLQVAAWPPCPPPCTDRGDGTQRRLVSWCRSTNKAESMLTVFFCGDCNC